jgi:tetratricopeptide (TPR) repeat protein
VGLTDSIVGLGAGEWQRGVTRLRSARLLLPLDPTAPDALDAHPLVREWFGERLRQTNESAWQAAHGRLYEFLRDTTKEGDQPNLKDLGPLYQAITHGCRAGRHQEALDQVYVHRICRGDEYYASDKLGANASNLVAISWFFDRPYENLAVGLIDNRQSVMNEAALYLRAQGRLTDALPVQRALLLIDEQARNWLGASVAASNLSETELVVGDIPDATRHAETAVEYAKRAGDGFDGVRARSRYGTALQAAGRRAEAFELFADAERRQRHLQPDYPLLFTVNAINIAT